MRALSRPARPAGFYDTIYILFYPVSENMAPFKLLELNCAKAFDYFSAAESSTTAQLPVSGKQGGHGEQL